MTKMWEQSRNNDFSLAHPQITDFKYKYIHFRGNKIRECILMCICITYLMKK